MEILILANQTDLKKKVGKEPLLLHMLEEFKKNHNVSVFSKYSDVRSEVEDSLLLPDIDLKTTLEKYKEGKESFMIITKLVISNIDYDKFKIYHDNHDKKCSIVLRNLVKGRTTPVYKLDEKKVVIDVNRKRYANCGIYIFDSTVDFSELKTLAALINDLMEAKELKAFIHAGYYEKNYEQLKGIDYRNKEKEKIVEVVSEAIKENGKIKQIMKENK